MNSAEILCRPIAATVSARSLSRGFRRGGAARATATSTCGACGAAHGAGPCRKTTRVECEHEDIPSCACPTRRTLITSAVAFVPAFLAASGARAAVLPSPTAVDDMEKRKMAREEMLKAARAKAAAQAAPAPAAAQPSAASQ